MSKENWQKNTKIFNKIKYGSPSLCWTQGLDYRLKLVKKYINFKNKKVLDVGCGIGEFLYKFKELGADVYGIDIDKEKVKFVQNNFSNVQVSPAEKLAFRSSTIDIVFLHEVLEHVKSDRRTLLESFRVLKSGGKAVIFAPNKLWPFETHGIYIKNKYIFGNIPFITYLPNSLYKKLTPHVRNYYRKDILKLLKGISYRKIHYQGVFPGFDKLAHKIPIFGKLIQIFFRILDKTPLNRFGISHFFILEKI